MQIRNWKIADYHGISNLEVTLPISENGDAVILLGENGSGKSSTLEALFRFFAAFDSPTLASELKSDCEISYRIGSRDITIRQKNLVWTVSHSEIGENAVVEDFRGSFDALYKWHKKGRLHLFPQRIVTFYSGYADNLAPIYKKANSRYERDCRAVLREYLGLVRSNRPEEIQLPQFPHKKYIYCDNSLTALYLAAIFAEEASYEKQKIQELCAIDGLIAIDVFLKPKTSKNLLYEFFSGNDEDHGIERNFWRVVEFIDSDMCTLMRAAQQSFREDLALFMIADIQNIPCNRIQVFNFFEKLVTLFDARISVRFAGKYGEKNVDMLSEGQRQLIKIIGMLGATKEADCFVMMDEPDSHMNPRWKYEIKEIIDNVLRDATNTQAIIATHDPLVVNGVEKEYVRLFVLNPDLKENPEESSVKVLMPTESTEGMGIDGILQSEYYGLNSTLDAETKSKLEEKKDLLVKRWEGTISPEEQEKLQLLTEEIENLTFSRNIPTDDLYDEFVVAMHKLQRENPISELTPEQIQERNRKAHEIIKGLMEK